MGLVYRISQNILVKSGFGQNALQRVRDKSVFLWESEGLVSIPLGE